MARYVSRINFTEHDTRDIWASPIRPDSAQAQARSLRGEVKQEFLTLGGDDMVAILESPDDEATCRRIVASP